MVRDEFLGAAGAGGGGGGNPTTPSNLVAFGINTGTANFLYIYNWSSSGFGSQLTNSPITLNGGLTGVCFSPDRTKIFFVTTASPFIHGYNITGSSVGSALASPSVLPSFIGNVSNSRLTVSKDNNYIAIPQDIYPFVSVYNLTSSGFGSKIASPSVTYPSGTVTAQAAAFSPDGTALVIGIGGSSGGVYTAAWQWSSAGFGTKYSSDPNWGTNGFNNYCTGVQFVPDGSAIVATINADYALPTSLSAWKWTYASGFGLKYANPNVIGGDTTTTRCVNVTSNAVLATAAGGLSAAPLNVYSWNNSTGFGARYAFTGTGLGTTDQSDDAKFSSTGDFIIAAYYNTPLNFNPTNKVIVAFTFSVAAGPAFFQYMPFSGVFSSNRAAFN